MSKNEYAAWDIALNILSRCRVPLQITKLHPCSGQYDCLALMPADAPMHTKSLALINLHGESIQASAERIDVYPVRYKKDKESLLQEIARNCGYTLAPDSVRKVACVQFLRDLHLDDRFTTCVIAAAWHDESDAAYLDVSAARSSFYDQKNRKNEVAPHFPWWTISVGDTTLAMCNTVTDELVTMRGARYNLTTQSEEASQEIYMLILQKEFEEVAASVISLLDHPQEDNWRVRYASYANDIEANRANIASVRKTFHEWDPLYLYINVSNSKQAKKKVQFELRYLGQTVADLISKEDLVKDLVLDTTKYNDNNLKYFDCDIQLDSADWRRKEAKAFRQFFKNRNSHIDFTGHNPSNEEHRLESLLLTEFSKKDSSKKALSNIQPVKIAGVRFPMPTPLSASNHKAIKYSGIRGGGIDILARTGKGGRATNLCIMELKDENNKREPPMDAMKQAIAYATFIRELLRTDTDETGQKWWELFGFGGKVPDKLTLFAACVLPTNGIIDTSFAGMEIAVGSDIIRLHYVYFEESKNKITRIVTSL